MEPVAAIVTALVVGAAAGMKDTATQAFKDGYAALKALLRRRIPAAPTLEPLAGALPSAEARAALERLLAQAGVAEDPEVLRLAQDLLARAEVEPPPALLGVDLSDVRSASLTLRDVVSSRGAVRVQRAVVEGDITIEGIRAGEVDPPSNR